MPSETLHFARTVRTEGGAGDRIIAARRKARLGSRFESGRAMRIVLVGINYSPERTGIAPYTARLAERLAERHEVTVITGVPHYPEWVCPPSYRRLRRVERLGDVRVIRLRHFVPRRQDALRRFIYEFTFCAGVFFESISKRADVIVGVSPALLTPATVKLVAKIKRAPCGVIVQDMMGKAALESGISGGVAVAKTAERIEMLALRRAAGIAVIDSGFARSLASAGVPAGRITVIRNWTHITAPSQMRNATRDQLGWRHDEFIALHSGNIGLKQNLSNLVDAARIAERNGDGMTFVIMGDGSQRDDLSRLASGLSNFRLMPPVSDKQYANVLSAADVLVLNERPGVTEMSVPSKLTSYFAAGRPVVAAAEARSAGARLVVEAKAGVVVRPDKPSELVEAIRELRKDPAAATAFGSAASQFARMKLSEESALARYESWLQSLADSAMVSA